MKLHARRIRRNAHEYAWIGERHADAEPSARNGITWILLLLALGWFAFEWFRP